MNEPVTYRLYVPAGSSIACATANRTGDLGPTHLLSSSPVCSDSHGLRPALWWSSFLNSMLESETTIPFCLVRHRTSNQRPCGVPPLSMLLPHAAPADLSQGLRFALWSRTSSSSSYAPCTRRYASGAPRATSPASSATPRTRPSTSAAKMRLWSPPCEDGALESVESVREELRRPS